MKANMGEQLTSAGIGQVRGLSVGACLSSRNWSISRTKRARSMMSTSRPGSCAPAPPCRCRASGPSGQGPRPGYRRSFSAVRRRLDSVLSRRVLLDERPAAIRACVLASSMLVVLEDSKPFQEAHRQAILQMDFYPGLHDRGAHGLADVIHSTRPPGPVPHWPDRTCW